MLPFLLVSLLPAADAAGLSVSARCHTGELRLHRQELGRSSPSMSRPSEAGYVDSTKYPIRIHYRKSTDADRASDVLLPIAEDIWETELAMGWQQPPADYGAGGSDSYDIYLTNYQTAGGAWTYTTYDNGIEPDAYDGDDYFTNSSFIALDDDSSWIPDDQLDDFLSHEFNHALQYATDANEYTLFAWENTAEATAEIYSGIGPYFKDEVSDFQSHPGLSILFDSYTSQVGAYGDDVWYYEYGGWIFGAFLEQRFGTNDGSELQKLWAALATGERSDDPDFVDALGVIGGADFPDAAQTYLEFTEWRLLLGDHDDGAHYSDGAKLPNDAEPGLQATLTLSTVDGTSVTPAEDEEPYYLGDEVWQIDVDAPSTQALHVELAGDTDTQWGIVAVGLLDGQPARVVKTRAGEGETATADLNLDGVTTVLVAAANLGPTDLDPEDTNLRKTKTFSMSFALQAPVVDDTGDGGKGGGGGEDGDGTGCGCATTDTPGAAGVVVAGVLLLAARRGRRS